MQNKLYSLYIPKHYGEQSLLPIVLRDFLTSSNYNNGVFDVTISPGYLGSGERFISKACDIFVNRVNKILICKGMVILSIFIR